MSEANLSEFEKLFLLHGIQDGLRLDGRNCEDYRPISVKFNCVSSSYGSCELNLGDTRVVASVKADLGEPDDETPKYGKLEFSVDCSANANPEFQGKGGDYISTEIVFQLNNLFSNENFDRKQLSIVDGKKCWIAYVDIVLLECNGNLNDACALAAKLALAKTFLPKLIVSADDEGEPEINISDNISDVVRLNVDNVPYSVTVCKIGHNYVVDADLKEESVTKARLTFGFDKNYLIKYTYKDGFGSLDPDTLFAMIDLAKNATKQIDKIFNSLL